MKNFILSKLGIAAVFLLVLVAAFGVANLSLPYLGGSSEELMVAFFNFVLFSIISLLLALVFPKYIKPWLMSLLLLALLGRTYYVGSGVVFQGKLWIITADIIHFINIFVFGVGLYIIVKVARDYRLRNVMKS